MRHNSRCRSFTHFFSRWNLVDGKEERIWGGHKGPVSALAVGDGVVYSAGQDGTIKVWKKGVESKTFVGHDDAGCVADQLPGALARDFQRMLTSPSG